MSEIETQHWLVRSQTVRRLWVGFTVVLTLLVLADMFIHPHANFGIDGTFGFMPMKSNIPLTVFTCSIIG